MFGNGPGSVPSGTNSGYAPGSTESDGDLGNGLGARTPGMYSENPPETMGNGPTNAVWQGPVDGANPVIPVYDLIGPRNLTSQGPGKNQQLSDMPAAGLPTRQIPRFDPCTGRECQPTPAQLATYGPGQPGQSGAYGMPMTCMYPCFCPLQCYPCPPAMNVCPPMQQGFGQSYTTNQTSNINDNANNKDKGERVDKTNSKSTLKERSERSKDVRITSRSPDSEKSSAKERNIAKASKPNKRDNQELELINCSNASPELIKRICDSLQVPNPPNSCYILLPIAMASKSKDKGEQPEKKSKKKPEMESPSVDDPKVSVPAEPKTNEKENPPATNVCKLTRNCGCNTLITGKFGEKSEKPEDSSAKNSCSPGANGACCSSACCYRPCYTYCYNPCTGCFYWRKKCCCCNGCCNNGGSCPMPKQASSPGTTSGSNGSKGPTASPPAKQKVPTDSAKGTSSGSASDQRFAAGAVSAFQPGVQELYDQWVGFQQHAVFPPMLPPRQQPPFMHRRFTSQSRDRDESQYRSPDIDWTPQ
ncbi:uncharacterized protein LOC117788784 [Drosophila innubila]|uniref:uncharacterized protein LOC117788784 n=1 Tax=Drosophila innubila TaxID=198719 RepID=UPI00148D0E52|nr:uncharacterized protein LOC117788784 [Drosophila innubila]